MGEFLPFVVEVAHLETLESVHRKGLNKLDSFKVVQPPTAIDVKWIHRAAIF